ncbi:MAG: serine/threonine protein kinase [Coriobacteriia bacterium]|nr:serine/threonine protein kinase [Coriobacteriia bacterium]
MSAARAAARPAYPAPDADAVDPQADAASLVLGRYRVLVERGKGGFGTVSVCWDPRLMRRVAIKVIPLHPATPSAGPSGKARKGMPTSPSDPGDAEQARADALLRAALAETRTASVLPHPNIVSMLDFEADADNAYIIMECVEGASLAELLDATDDGLLTPDEAAAVADAVGDALAFAHENGVLHLDIKPDNILIDASGRVRLADFGMATLSTATGYSNAVGGTIGYMPPEQLQAGQVDVRTDVFAFAAVMYEALTGTRPFAAPSVKKSLELVCGQLADPCALNEDVTPQAADALLTALDPDPEVRPTSVRAFADELLAGLGSLRAGRQSLAALVADVTCDEAEPADDEGGVPAEPGAYDDELGPLGRSHPRLASWLMRGLAGFAAGWVAALVALACVGAPAGTDAGPTSTTTSSDPIVAAASATSQATAPAAGADATPASTNPVPASASPLPAGTTTALVVGLVVFVVGTAAPQLAGALAVASLVVGCLALRQWALAVAVLALGIAWWLFVVRREPLGTGTPLAGAIGAQLASPLPPVLAALLLTPARAAASAAFALTVGLTIAALAGTSSLSATSLASLAATSPAQATSALIALLSDPLTWVRGAGWAAAAAAGAGLCAQGGKTRCYLGILSSSAILILFQLVISRMENGGLWAAPAAQEVVSIIASSILAYIVVALLGTPRSLFTEEAVAPDDDLAREDL